MNFDPTISIPVVIMILGLAGTGVGVWYNTRGQVQKNTERIKELGDLLAIANAKTALAIERAEEIRARTAHELAEYKLQVAKEYATNQAIGVIEERIVQAIERLGDRMDKFFDSTRK